MESKTLSKRSRPEPKYTFDSIHAMYQVISKFPGNDYTKTDFWMKATKYPIVPKKLKEFDPEEIVEMWKSIKAKIPSIQQFKSLFRDYDKTNIKGNKYHEEIKASIVDIFFGGKTLDTPLKKRKIIDSEEEMPETNAKEEPIPDSIESDSEVEKHTNKERVNSDSEVDNDEGETQNALKETEVGIKEEPNSPRPEQEIKEEKIITGVIGSTPPKSETAPSVKEGTPIISEDTFIHQLQDPKDLTEPITVDRNLTADLNRLYKINGKVTTNAELFELDRNAIDFFCDNNVTADAPFVKIFLAVVDKRIPESMLNRSHNVKKMKPIETVSEEVLKVRQLSKETGKSEEEVKRVLFGACDDVQIARRALNGEDIRLWTPKEDQILTQSTVSKEYIELLKVNGKDCLLNRIQYLKKHSPT